MCDNYGRHLKYRFQLLLLENFAKALTDKNHSI